MTERVRVTHRRVQAARRAPARAVVHEIDEQTRLGEVYMSSLIRSQRRLAVVTVLTVALLLGGVAVAGGVAPGFARLRVFGLPVPWLVLGALVYPALIALAWYTVRHAERNERTFTELVRRRE
ncbi:MAG: hypothetical protein ACTHMS_15230 [Jatrophihabitans sp.]|uniref:hypothetical protein n=1 Tax=Jatrophihabitans sp. TaxID=1932789 RepID=UPI003F7D389D